MNTEPIPNELLGDDIFIQKPSQNGWTDLYISNVRAERSSTIESGYPDKPREKTKLTVWYDCVNSRPQTEVECGMRIRFNGEIFDIVSVRVIRAKTPHHLKITAVKIGEYT
ncbi:MAG: hypothetical protein J1F03_04390 [Oscillospiraceae bacterium]|nr:hypothetical protein [Oscillospiraceae bacterium]